MSQPKPLAADEPLIAVDYVSPDAPPEVQARMRRIAPAPNAPAAVRKAIAIYRSGRQRGRWRSDLRPESNVWLGLARFRAPGELADAAWKLVHEAEERWQTASDACRVALERVRELRQLDGRAWHVGADGALVPGASDQLVDWLVEAGRIEPSLDELARPVPVTKKKRGPRSAAPLGRFDTQDMVKTLFHNGMSTAEMVVLFQSATWAWEPVQPLREQDLTGYLTDRRGDTRPAAARLSDRLRQMATESKRREKLSRSRRVKNYRR